MFQIRNQEPNGVVRSQNGGKDLNGSIANGHNGSWSPEARDVKNSEKRDLFTTICIISDAGHLECIELYIDVD
jgi:hypothetical protein